MCSDLFMVCLLISSFGKTCGILSFYWINEEMNTYLFLTTRERWAIDLHFVILSWQLKARYLFCHAKRNKFISSPKILGFNKSEQYFILTYNKNKNGPECAPEVHFILLIQILCFQIQIQIQILFLIFDTY